MAKNMVKDMTKGSPWKAIVSFALPLLFGNLFQQAYNMLDTMIVGRYAGPNALAGVGIASPIFNLLNALLIGLSVGSSILISQLFGAKEEKKIKQAVSTVLITSFIVSIVLTLAGHLLTEPILHLLKTPAEDFPYAKEYLRVIITGLTFNVFYNQLAGILRGVGNSRIPLYFLVFSCGINACMDVLFVACWGWGVFGAALSTILAEGLSAILTAIYIWKKVPVLAVHKSDLKNGSFSKEIFDNIIRFGLPMGFQQASISLGHVLMQAIVNPFGTAVIAAYTSAVKIDLVAVMPIISIGSAASTFSGQNAGAGDYERVKLGYRTTNMLTVIVCLCLTAIVVPTRAYLMNIFVSVKDYPELAGEIIRIGMEYLMILPCFYVILGLIHAALNTMAGAGDTKFSMISMILMMALRVVFAFIYIYLIGMNHSGIWWAFPTSWGLTLLFVLNHYKSGVWKKKSISNK